MYDQTPLSAYQYVGQTMFKSLGKKKFAIFEFLNCSNFILCSLDFKNFIK